MHIDSLLISNFRGIRRFEIRDLSKLVVIAGPNGSGKSTVFEAIRLLKSAYGEYTKNEDMEFFSSYGIKMERIDAHISEFFFDPKKKIEIKIIFSLSPAEIQFLTSSTRRLLEEMSRDRMWGIQDISGDLMLVNPARSAQPRNVAAAQIAKLERLILDDLKKPTQIGHLEILPKKPPIIHRAPVLELIFSTYRPEEVGVIAFQPAHRQFSRERLSGINLNLDASNAAQSLRGFHFSSNRPANIKNQIAQSYVRDLIAKKAGGENVLSQNLDEAIKNLFSLFFPRKTFMGAKPTVDGFFEFPVNIGGDIQHDLDELSSGEKEIILGYLRLRSETPRHSIVLLDEPELHLHPRLARNMPEFYWKHVCDDLQNQVWFVTHSDAMLREAIGQPYFSVFHMEPSLDGLEEENQATRIDAQDEFKRALINLVGDLATFNPKNNYLLIEGENSQFDERMITLLFPQFANKVNFLSTGPRKNVLLAHKVLEEALIRGKIEARIFSIVDRDAGIVPAVAEPRHFIWDRYHIENYLLEPAFIRAAIASLSLKECEITDHQINQMLMDCAKDVVKDVVRITMQHRIGVELRQALALRVGSEEDLTTGFSRAIAESSERVSQLSAKFLSSDRILAMEQEERKKLETALDDGTWIELFPGREILRRFVHRSEAIKVRYEIFHPRIVHEMRQAGFEPVGMQKILQSILAAASKSPSSKPA